MSDVHVHYETLLAARYVWMHGDFEERARSESALLQTLGIDAGHGATALDLGCGPGYQSIALGRHGWRVTALDSSAQLLDELRRAAGALPIVTVHADLRECAQHVPAACELAVCMGDTLTHLASRDEVHALFRDLAAALAPGARAVLTWRTLDTELAGTDRFIPVRADADRIMTCFLEYAPESVRVHDVVHERDGGSWRMHTSSYTKLRLPLAWVAAALAAAGFDIEIARPGAFTALVARRP